MTNSELRPAVPGRRSAAALLVVAGLGFVLFPALRPWPDESGPTAGLAAAFASDRWVVAHLCGIFAIALLAPALRSLAGLYAGTAGERPARWAAAAAGTGALWSALYFGAEAFGLQSVAEAAVASGDVTGQAYLDTITDLRNQPLAITLFGVGLLLVAAAGVLAAVAVWRSGAAARWAGVPFATGLVLLLPQFWGGPPVRVAHGVLLGLGCVLLVAALDMHRQSLRAKASRTG
ncbi:hypothetical protein [Antribacter gilvus]|uniref:hypothetical protein n=1 Tax=Antribacter gilvus TaxID=2304675 RepID=UPI000F787D3A|nr:hypothetical protein [Antribacter gilvus]